MNLKSIVIQSQFLQTQINQYFFGKRNLSDFKNLKIICTASTGTIHIDKDYCSLKEIKVISLKEERKVINKIPSTAEHALL